MTQAIITRYHGPTTFRGARITARCSGGKATIGWDHGMNGYGNHRAAALALVAKMGWRRPTTQWVGGCLPDESGFAFVEVPRA